MRHAAGLKCPSSSACARALRAPCRISHTRSRVPIVCRAVVQTDAAEVAKQLLAAEQELQSMFESGKPMPKAAVVAAKRAEVEKLRATLEGRMSELEDQTPEDPEEAERARKAFAELERYLNGSLMGHDDDDEIARLESENAQLRVTAHRLLLRQQRLEEVAMSHGIPLPGGDK